MLCIAADYILIANLTDCNASNPREEELILNNVEKITLQTARVRLILDDIGLPLLPNMR
jgi:hypothetical protein